MPTILYLDHGAAAGPVLADTLDRLGHSLLGAATVPQALQALQHGQVDLVISGLRSPGLSGLEFLALLRQEGYAQPVIMLTPGAADDTTEALRAGADDCLATPVIAEHLGHAVTRALEHARIRRENDLLRRQAAETRNERQIIGDSATMRRLVATAGSIAASRSTVLLQGESGTGKDLFARAIHDLSDRRDGPFIKLNCAALPDGLAESTLFGHEKGAFAGAIRRAEGAFERAHRGTLLLDDVGELRLDLQARLLRVLQDQSFERVGGTSPVAVDVRVIATSSRRLLAEVEAGRFRRDLYYRLSAVALDLPPLRERREDIPRIAYRFGMRVSAEVDKDFAGITPEALALLAAHDWPGNVRELQHAVERAVLLSDSPMLQATVFDTLRPGASYVAQAQGTGASVIPDGAVLLTTLNVAAAEARLIERALQVTGGNRTRAAELLGVSIRTLRNKLNTPVRAAQAIAREPA